MTRAMSPPREERPKRVRRPAKDAEQSQNMLEIARARNKKKEARDALKLRRTQQEQEVATPTRHSLEPPSPVPTARTLPPGKGKQPHANETGTKSYKAPRPNPQSHPTSPPSTTQATVNASITGGAALQDPKLRELLDEENRWREDMAWFKKHHPDLHNRVSTLTPDKLQQYRRELGPGPTLPNGHNPYRNVHVNLPPPVAKKSLLRSSQGDPHLLGVNSSFSQGEDPTQPPFLPARPKPTGTRFQLTQPRSRLANDARGLLHAPAVSQPTIGPTRAVTQQSSFTHHPLPRAPSPPQQRIPPTREPPTASERGLREHQQDFDRIMQIIDDRLSRGKAASGRGPKPTRNEWGGRDLQLLDRAALDAKAALIASGFMKGAEDRELLILQSWDRTCKWYGLRPPYPNITLRQITYIQNLFPSHRNGMKTRVMIPIISKLKIRQGTLDERRKYVASSIPHGFHTAPPDEMFDELPFENDELLVGVLVAMIFCDSKDVGIKFNSYFNPITPRCLAFACALVADILDEHSSGDHKPKPTYLDHLRPHYNRYISSLKNLCISNAERYGNMLKRLHDKCIDASHAIREEEDEASADDVIPVGRFDQQPVLPYQPRYTVDQINATLTKHQIIMEEESSEGPSDSMDDDNGFEGETGDYGEAGPGPSTTHYRQGAGSEMDEDGEEREGTDDGDGGDDGRDQDKPQEYGMQGEGVVDYDEENMYGDSY